MKRRLIAWCMTMVMAVSILAGITFPAKAASITTVKFTVRYCQTDSRTELKMINDFRASSDAWVWNEDDTTKTVYSNLSPLEYDYELEKVAMQRCAEIALSYSHDRPDGGTCWDTYKDLGYTNWTALGENIAVGQGSPSEVFQAWREDKEPYAKQGHRRSMLSPDYNRVGVAGCYYNGRYFWVQEFSRSSASVGSVAANDSDTLVSAKVDLDKATVNIQAPSSLTIPEGGSVNLPEVKVTMSFSSSYNKNCPIQADATYKIADNSIASISGNTIQGLKGGKTSMTVTALNQSVTVNIEVSHQHSYSSKVTAATCTKDGYTTYTCSACGDSYTEKITATGHNYKKGDVVASTCTEKGYTTYTCANCGDSYKGDETAATGHDYQLKSTTQENCEKAGTATYECSRCHNTKTESVPAGTHSWDNGKVTTQPTCKAEGVKTYTCGKCGATKTEKIAMVDHSWDNGRVTTQATCTADGVKTFTCGTCGQTRTEKIAATGHNYKKGSVVAPTCTEKGYTPYTCDNCGDSYKSDETAALDHDWELTSTDRKTCDEEGTANYRCNRCGNTRSEKLAAGSHSWDPGNVTTWATCTTDGVKTYTCYTCGKTKNEKIAATGHNYKKGDVVAPTCTEKGYTPYTCEDCGDSYISDEKAALDHNWELTETLRESCEKGGNAYYECTRCATQKIEKLAPMEHDWNEGVVTVPPTADKEGTRTYTCKNCQRIREESIPPLGQEPEEKELELGRVHSYKNTTKGLKFSWDKVAGADGYDLYRREIDLDKMIQNEEYVTTVTGDTTSYTDNGVKNGYMVIYFAMPYRQNADGTYSQADCVSSYYYYLKRPTQKAVVSAETGMIVSWGKNTKADGYMIYRSVDGGSYKKVKTIKKNSTVTWTDTNLTNGSVYKYKVYAYAQFAWDDIGTQTYKSYGSAVKTTAFLSRGSITSVSNSASKAMTVKWKKNSSANGYEIQYSLKSDFSSGLKTKTITKKSTISSKITGLTKGRTYYVRVRSYKTVDGTKYYGTWSLKKSVKISR